MNSGSRVEMFDRIGLRDLVQHFTAHYGRRIEGCCGLVALYENNPL